MQLSSNTVNIIYTPDADQFRLNDIHMLFSSGLSENHPSLRGLRLSVDQLKKNFSEVPKKVGVVTYHEFFKEAASKNLDARTQDDFIEFTTNYTPLDIINAILKYKLEDSRNPLEREMVYRALSYLVSDDSFFDTTLTAERLGHIVGAALIPEFDAMYPYFDKHLKNEEFVKKYPLMRKTLKELYRMVKKTQPTKWGDLESLGVYFRERFEANEVSREFPLFFHPPSSFTPSLYSVDLEGEIIDPFAKIKNFQFATGSSEDESISASIQKAFESHPFPREDTFGATQSHKNFDQLLEAIPHPKTIITDLYIVDQFPQLKRNIHTFEYNPN